MSELIADTSGAGPAVVLLHGQPGSRGDWSLVTHRLAADYLVIAPDRPGYGETGGRARGFRGNAAAVISLLDRLGLERATVVGYSWAGGVALALADAAPQRLTGVVLVSSVCPGEPHSPLDRMLAVPPIGTAVTAAGLFLASRALDLAPLRRFLYRRTQQRPAQPHLRRASTNGAGTNRDRTNGDRTNGAGTPVAGAPPAAEATAVGATAIGAVDATWPDRGDFPAPQAVVASWRNNRVWQSFVTEQRCLIDELPLLESGLATIGVPTVVLVGTGDRTVPPASSRRLAREIPSARLVELAGAGHLLPHHYPDTVAAAVREVTPRANGGRD